MISGWTVTPKARFFSSITLKRSMPSIPRGLKGRSIDSLKTSLLAEQYTALGKRYQTFTTHLLYDTPYTTQTPLLRYKHVMSTLPEVTKKNCYSSYAVYRKSSNNGKRHSIFLLWKERLFLSQWYVRVGMFFSLLYVLHFSGVELLFCA